MSFDPFEEVTPSLRVICSPLSSPTNPELLPSVWPLLQNLSSKGFLLMFWTQRSRSRRFEQSSPGSLGSSVAGLGLEVLNIFPTFRIILLVIKYSLFTFYRRLNFAFFGVLRNKEIGYLLLLNLYFLSNFITRLRFPFQIISFDTFNKEV